MHLQRFYLLDQHKRFIGLSIENRSTSFLLRCLGLDNIPLIIMPQICIYIVWSKQLYMVFFCYLTYGLGYCLIMMHSFIAASCVRELGLEVETLEKPFYVSSPLGTRVRVDLMCQDCELEISGILLTVDLRVMDMSEFDVILGMDWLTAHRVVIDCKCRRVMAYTLDGDYVTFQGDKHDTLP